MKIQGEYNLEKYTTSLKRLNFAHSTHFDSNEIDQIVFDSVFYVQIPDSLTDPEIY